MSITLLQICDAVRDTLGAAPSLVREQSLDELTESIPDTPLLQVYPERGSADPSGNTDRTTFSAVVRQSIIVIHADLYAHQRSHIGEDMSLFATCVDELITEIEKQDTKPYFGLDG